ncbi:MAG: hypothetical protein IPM34_08370 [Saprospiraceae bacterium]|nr:hypothetical protein [Saprospiraceae bacterium]
MLKLSIPFVIILIFGGCFNNDFPERPSKLIRVEVDSIPANTSGQPWDANDGPDLILLIIEENKDTIFVSNKNLFQNSSAGPYKFYIDPGYNYIPYEYSYSLHLFDLDTNNTLQFIDSTRYSLPYPLYYPFCEKYKEISIWKFLVVEQ